MQDSEKDIIIQKIFVFARPFPIVAFPSFRALAASTQEDNGLYLFGGIGGGI